MNRNNRILLQFFILICSSINVFVGLYEFLRYDGLFYLMYIFILGIFPFMGTCYFIELEDQQQTCHYVRIPSQSPKIKNVDRNVKQNVNGEKTIIENDDEETVFDREGEIFLNENHWSMV